LNQVKYQGAGIDFKYFGLISMMTVFLGTFSRFTYKMGFFLVMTLLFFAVVISNIFLTTIAVFTATAVLALWNSKKKGVFDIN
jgi:hypothetical protein